MANSSDSSVEDDSFVDAIDNGTHANYTLHQAVFEKRPVSCISGLLNDGEDIALKDVHGNTPLHLAIMLGHKDIINLLLQNNAPIKTRNLQGWTPLDEAISYGDRKIIRSVLRVARKQARQTMNARRPKLIEALKLIKDFQMELKWEFYSWIPLVKRFLPSDTCRITKKGCSIRLDTTLLDFSERNWQRGDITFLFVGDKKPSQALAILDNELKVYQNIRYNESADIEEDIDLLMSSDIIYPQMSTKSITFARTQTGWFFSRYNKTEKVGQFEADFYNINGLTMETKKRREHLSEEDVQSNKQLYETFKQSFDNKSNEQPGIEVVITDMSKNSINLDGSKSSSNCSLNETEFNDVFDDSTEDNAARSNIDFDSIEHSKVSIIKRRKSLQPPSLPNVSFLEYIQASVGNPPCLGRPIKSKDSVRNFKATLAMSKEFPLSIESLFNILEVVAPFKHFNKLRDFIRLNLPPGFPVKIDIPIIPTVLARVTFLNFQYNNKISDTLFDIPCDYTEDLDRFPDI